LLSKEDIVSAEAALAANLAADPKAVAFGKQVRN
jgi:hypothetical protein